VPTPGADKGNEITAIPTLLDMLELPGAVVSIDAMGWGSIAGKIVQKKADYVLALKDNHPQLFEDVRLWLDSEFDAQRLTIHETLEKGHGRLETLRYVMRDRLDWLGRRLHSAIALGN